MHVGHRVEVTGTLETRKTASAATSETGATSTASADQRLKVSSVRMISADCSSK
jgi:hypothetical protein